MTLTISSHGQSRTLSDVELLEEVFRQQGPFVPRRAWLIWHLDHGTSMQAIFAAAGVPLPEAKGLLWAS